jgi:hypothetical protein
VTTLLVSGDSWTSCWPLEERLGHRDFGWPNLVSQHFDFDLIDKSRAGSSNYRIYRKAFDGIISNGADLVLVFLTQWSRFEKGATYGVKPGRIYQHIASDDSSDTAFRLFFHGYKIYTDILRQIISLQTLSKITNIPCYFLDTFDNNIILDISMEDFEKILQYNVDVFENMDDDRVKNKFFNTKRLTDRIDRSTFISEYSYQSLIKDCSLDRGHPMESGHRKIADIVINFLERKNYGQTF